MLRAVRFSAVFGFELHGGTFDAICRMADQITVVSAELTDVLPEVAVTSPDTETLVPESIVIEPPAATAFGLDLIE